MSVCQSFIGGFGQFLPHLFLLVKVNSTILSIKSDRISLVAPASPILGTVQTGTGKVDPTRKFKITTATRVLISYWSTGLTNEMGCK